MPRIPTITLVAVLLCSCSDSEQISPASVGGGGNGAEAGNAGQSGANGATAGTASGATGGSQQGGQGGSAAGGIGGSGANSTGGSGNTAGSGGTAGTGATGGTGGVGGNSGTGALGGSGGSTGGTAGTAGQSGSGGSAGTAGVGGGGHNYSINDVSILFPTETLAEQYLYRADSTANYGALLPYELLDLIGTITVVNPAIGGSMVPEDPMDTYSRLRVVSVRIDPCFPKLINGGTCRYQVRLVMQPQYGDGLYDDAALHIFYDLPSDDFDLLLADFDALVQGASVPTTGPLSVHPVLSAEGLDGAYATNLRDILFSYIGEKRLSRVTAMQTVITGALWRFRGYNITPLDPSGFDTVPIGVINTPEYEQSIQNTSTTGFDATVSPTFVTDQDMKVLWKASDAQSASDFLKNGAYNAALLVENPKLRDVENESCVKCHTAMVARVWAENNLGLSSAGNPSLYTSIFDLSETTTTEMMNDTTVLRAFGYRHDEPIISQRSINESAAVAGYLNGTGP